MNDDILRPWEDFLGPRLQAPYPSKRQSLSLRKNPIQGVERQEYPQERDQLIVLPNGVSLDALNNIISAKRQHVDENLGIYIQKCNEFSYFINYSVYDENKSIKS